MGATTKTPTTVLSLGALTLAVLGLAGCNSAEQSPRALAGTAWQLISIQSMDDAQGTTAVPDPGKFTVEFGTDGKALFQLDCNRGHGSYTVSPSDDGVSGSLEFGPIATTLMLCPQPSMDQQVSRALTEVRGYIFKDDQLHLSKQADGGILTWQPAPATSPSPTG